MPNTPKTEFDDVEGDAATAATTVPAVTVVVVITGVRGDITGTAATGRAEKRLTGLTLNVAAAATAVATGIPDDVDTVTAVGLGELLLATPFVIDLIFVWWFGELGDMVWLKQGPCDDILGIETEMLFVDPRPFACNEPLNNV